MTVFYLNYRMFQQLGIVGFFLFLTVYQDVQVYQYFAVYSMDTIIPTGTVVCLTERLRVLRLPLSIFGSSVYALLVIYTESHNSNKKELNSFHSTAETSSVFKNLIVNMHGSRSGVPGIQTPPLEFAE